MDKQNGKQIFKPMLTVMCGLQGSGKSTFAHKLSPEVEVVSSDEIRKEFPDIKNDTVFKILYERVNKFLADGKNVVIDATNTTIKARKQIFLNVKQPCFKVCMVINTPYDVCIERVRQRNKDSKSHYVPEEVVLMYRKSFEIPFYEEGWDLIGTYNQINRYESIIYLDDLLKKADGFDQHNKHHTQDLGLHMKSTEIKAKKLKVDPIVAEAAKYHDIGKLFTQTFGEDGQGHYYNHANVGAYDLLCNSGLYYFDRDNGNWVYDYHHTLEWLFYINYHMHMYNLKTDKAIKKWKDIFGEEKFNQLKLLNQADMSNHSKLGESEDVKN